MNTIQNYGIVNYQMGFQANRKAAGSRVAKIVALNAPCNRISKNIANEGKDIVIKLKQRIEELMSLQRIYKINNIESGVKRCAEKIADLKAALSEQNVSLV